VSALPCRPPLTLCRPRYSSTWGRACWSVRPYLALVPAARALGLPSAAAIGAHALLVTGPLMIGILKVSSHRRPGEPTIALRRVPTVAATLGWATLMICAAAAAFVLTRPVAAWLERTVF